MAESSPFGMPVSLVARTVAAGVAVACILLLPTFMSGGFHPIGSLDVALFCIVFGQAAAFTVVFLSMTPEGMRRRTRRRLRALKQMHAEGLIVEAEYEQRRSDAVSRL